MVAVFQEQPVQASKLLPNVKASFSSAVLEHPWGPWGGATTESMVYQQRKCPLQMDRNICVTALIFSAIFFAFVI